MKKTIETKKPCGKCGTCVKYASSYVCKKCHDDMRAAAKRQRESNIGWPKPRRDPDEFMERAGVWYG